MAAAAPPSWLAHPHAQALLRFDLLPSQWLDASRAERALPAALHGIASLHRQASAWLRRERRLAPVLTLDDPALPAALLAPEPFARLVKFAGVAVLAVPLRRAIQRDQVAALRDQLGEDGLQFARHGPWPAPIPAIEETIRATDVAAQCEAWGGGLLARAFDAATPAVAARAVLRLPTSADEPRERLDRAGLEAQQALGAVRDLLKMLEPQWLSSFPAAR